MKQVAVVGMSFRFPGTSTETYWADLLAGRNLVTEVDPTRWAKDRLQHPRKSNPGTSYSYAAGSLGDISGFDAGFFGISPREAAQMDPQQRLMLELAWEALENSGIRPSSLRGSDCGVYVGISSGDYGMRMADDLGAIDAMMITGNTSSIAANRISYVLDLRGPSMALDTACSSSLVAFHQACRAIRSGECPIALAGGVSLHLHPLPFVAFSKASMLSRRGLCNVFDADGDGYVRSEGGGVFVLKELDQAIADGDTIWAIVAATGVNTDGRKSGLTVPSRRVQAALLTRTYQAAGIEPTDIAYLEAHGTGTQVGDPIETGALGDALGRFRPKDQPLLIGSVKSNLGHLEAASGVAGMVKALHCIRHREVPATIHLRKPNPHIDFETWNLRVVTETTALPATGRLIVGVNSFGFGGANAHVILQSPSTKVSAIPARAPSPTRSVTLPVVVSARSESALKEAAARLAQYLRTHPQVPLREIASTATLRRDWHEHRAVAYGATHKSLAGLLENFARGQSGGAVVSCTALPSPVTVAFVYSGNGSQWEGMGRRLLAEDAVFKAAVLAVEQSFEKFADFSLEAELAGGNGTGRYTRTEIAQPALFAIQIGVTEMLRSRGVFPSVVLGHSVGEVAAAWASGALTLEQAVEVIFHRSQLQGETAGHGQMMAVAIGAPALRTLLESLTPMPDITVAGINSANGVTIAGSRQALDALEAELLQRKATYKRLDLDYAFHGPTMDPIEGELRSRLAGLRPRAETVRFVSTVTGQALAGTRLDADYWWQNVRQPVLFAQAVASAQAGGSTLFVEIGPHAVLKGYIDSILKDQTTSSGRVVSTLARGDDAPERVWTAASQVLLAGGPVDLRGSFEVPGRLVPLPNYPWQREALWHPVTSESNRLLHRHPVHPLLGNRMAQAEACWENQIDLQLQPTLADHIVGGAVVFPGAGFAELGMAVARQIAGLEMPPDYTLDLEELEILAPLLLSPDSSKLLRVQVDPSDGRWAVRARDRGSDASWTVHATGRILESTGNAALSPGMVEPHPLRPPDFSGAWHQALMQSVGLEYGPAYQAVDAGWVEGDCVWALLRPAAVVLPDLPTHLLHPALLDAALQLVAHLLHPHAAERSPQAYVPVRIGRLRLHAAGTPPVLARVRLLHAGTHSLHAELQLADAEGRIVFRAEGVRFRSIQVRKEGAEQLQFLEWAMLPAPRASSQAHAWPGLLDELAEPLGQVWTDLQSDRPLQAYLEQMEPLLDVLCASFAHAALRELAGATDEFSDSMAVTLSESQTGLAPLLVWMLDMLEEDEIVVRGLDGWQFQQEASPANGRAIWNALLGEHPEHFALTHAVGRVGLHLAQMFRGAASADQLSTRALHPARALAVLLGHAGWGRWRRGLATAVGRCLARVPPGHRLRVAELCADGPALLGQLQASTDGDRLECLSVMIGTDPASAQAGEAEMAGHTQSSRIDIAQVEQAPYQGSRDLVIVAQAWASCGQLLQALRGARTLLAPGGVLVFLGLPDVRWAHLVFGLSPGWWTDSDSGTVRPPVGTTAQWRALLLEEGFELSAPSRPTETTRASAFGLPEVLLAQRRAEEPVLAFPPPAPKASPDDSGRLLLVAPESGTTDLPLAERLRAAVQQILMLHRVRGTDWLQSEVVMAQLQALQAAHGRIAGIVDLPPERGADAPSPARCAMLAALALACERLQLAVPVWVVCEGDGDADGTAAFVRTLRNEPSRLDIRVIGIDADAVTDAGMLDALVTELLAPDAETELVFRQGGARFAPRLRTATRQVAVGQTPGPEDSVRLSFSMPGQLRNLRWETDTPRPPGSGEIRIAVAATGLNFRDVMYALGMLSDEAVEAGFSGATLGLECAGTVAAVGPGVTGLQVGDRVLAFGGACFGRSVTTRASAAARLPDTISMEAAATIPTTFFTAYYALHHLARLRPGEKVLIHGAAGGVGIAAIQIARHIGAEVYASAGSDEKRDFLHLLGADHVFDSRSLAFADQILAQTGGQGIDVVLNSLAGEAINRNLRILRPFGRFLELGKRDFYENTRIGLRPFRNNVSYFGIDADQLLVAQPDLAQSLFTEVMALFHRGVLHPLPFTAFEAAQVVDAFRHMQQARQIGKIVVTYFDPIPHIHRAAVRRPELVLESDASYIVSGGLGGFGLSSAQWLVRKGARHLVLLGRHGEAAPEAQAAVGALRAQGVVVHAPPCDVADLDSVRAVLQGLAGHMPAVRGVLHAAAIYDDALWTSTDAGRLQRVFAPKAIGAWNLHLATADVALDFFVLYSSVTTMFGNPGQSAYVAANASVESLARRRRASGLPALCVRWGPIGDVGYLARQTNIREALQSRTGGHALPAERALDLLEELLLADRSDLAVADLHWRTLARYLPSAGEPKFSVMAALAGALDSGEDMGQDITRMLRDLPPEQLSGTFREMLKAEIGAILRIAPDKIDDHGSVYDLGLDSLMGVELALAIESRFGAKLPVMVLSDSPTVARLADQIIVHLTARPESPEAGELAALQAHLQATASQHAVDTDAQTIAQFATELQGVGTEGRAQRMIR